MKPSFAQSIALAPIAQALGAFALFTLVAGTSLRAQEPSTETEEPKAIQLGSEEWKEEAEWWGQSLVDSKQVVGVVAGAVQGQTTWIQGFGSTTLGGDVTPDGDTVFEIGSITKTFTGVLLADAMLRGEIRAEDPVQKFMPEGCTLIERKAPIQLIHLANHTSGWPRLPMPFEPADPLNPYADIDEEALFAFLCDHKPAWKPGRLYAYSNLGAGALGHFLASNRDLSFDGLLASRITLPLGMKSTRVQLNDDMRARLARPYTVDFEPGHLWDFDALAGAGGIRSTVRDMLIYAKAAMSGREDVLGGAFTESLKVTYEGRRGPTVAMGWHLDPGKGLAMHSGATGGYHSILILHPESQAGVIVLANTASGNVDWLGANLMRMLLGESRSELEARPTVELTAEQLKPLVGQYELAPKAIFSITQEGNKLFAQLTGQDRYRIYAESETKFFYRVVDAQISFELDDQGRCVALTLHQGGDRRAPRLKEDQGGE